MGKHIAIDIGASSGRHMLGSLENGKITLSERYRFENKLVTKNGHLCWDMDMLFHSVVEGLKACAPDAPASVGIDTWGVDFVLLDENAQPLGDCVSYRDSRTQGMDALLDKRISRSELFAFTGTAYQPFNTVYQLMALFSEHPEYKERAQHFLMIPDYLNYLLTGVMANEYTNASTTGLLDAATNDWCEAVLDAADIPRALFEKKPLRAGQTLGRLKPELAREIGCDMDVLLPATHDTGSAYMAVPARDENAVYLSSGTWSLLGVELDKPRLDEKSRISGFSNEGGYDGGKRYLKNIMGLWILQCVGRELDKPMSYADMAALAAKSNYKGVFDANDSRFLSPESMTKEVLFELDKRGFPKPEGVGDLVRAVIQSLASCYSEAIADLEGALGRRFTSVNVVGGGSRNELLGELTARETGLPVYAGPAEGTALGNIVCQMLAAGEISSLSAARALIREQYVFKVYEP